MSEGFIIEANDDGRLSWLSAANHRGFRWLVDRAQAEVFATRENAQSTIDELRAAFVRAGVRLSVMSPSNYPDADRRALGFIVKAIGRNGTTICTWLTAPSVDGISTLGIRKTAMVFATKTEALLAIAAISQHADTSDGAYSVEPAK